VARKGIASTPSGPIVGGRKSESPTGAALVRRAGSSKSVSGIDQYSGNGIIQSGREVKAGKHLSGGALVRRHKAPSVAASRPRAGTRGTHPGAIARAFSGPDHGISLKNKGAMHSKGGMKSG
jgi:hypothetical protein